MTVSGWFPSYAVVAAHFDKKDATIITTIFWGTLTVFRFLSLFLPVKGSTKIKALLPSIILCGVFCLILHLNKAYGAAVIFGAISFGICCSATYPLLLSVSV